MLIAAKLVAIYLLYDGSLKSFAIALLLGEVVSAPVYIFVVNRLLRVSLQPWAIDVCKTLLASAVAGTALALLVHQALDSVPVLVRLLVTFPCMVFLSALCFNVLRLPIANELRNALTVIFRSRKP